MEMWELKLSKKEKTNSSFLSLSLVRCQAPLLVHILSFEMSSVASTPVLSAFHEGWNTILEFSKTVLASATENNWSDFILFLLEEESGRFTGWPPLLFYLFVLLTLFQVLLEIQLLICFWLYAVPIIHWPCKFLFLDWVYFYIFLWRPF